jgi:hypothetical protein
MYTVKLAGLQYFRRVMCLTEASDLTAQDLNVCLSVPVDNLAVIAVDHPWQTGHRSCTRINQNESGKGVQKAAQDEGTLTLRLDHGPIKRHIP